MTRDQGSADVLAHYLARMFAESHISTNAPMKSAGGKTWFDISRMPHDSDAAAQLMATQVGYLRRRKLLAWHPTNPVLCRIIDADQSQEAQGRG